ncbi:hypothetical protein ACB092_09G211600 [Castanea dentata]
MAKLAYGIAVKVLEQLGSRAFQEISSAWGVRSDLKKLELTVATIKAVLLDAEEKQASDHRLRIWLGELKNVLNDVENVLDEFHYRVMQKEVLKRYGSTSKKVCHFFSTSNPLAVRFELAHKIKDIRKRVDDIAALKDKFNLAERLEDRKIINMHQRRDMTHSFVNPQNVIGRDDDKEEIIDLFMDPFENAGRNVNVIPIVGIGGLGKTTLAKLVYNDERVVSHFQLRMWVCVSEDFNVTRLIKEILKSAKVTIDENLGIDQWKTSLRELLKDKKFLLVLDDVWNEDHNKWIELEDLLLGGCNGSKIIVTTRNDSVATIMGTTPTFNLDGLSQDDCLSLFVTLAFQEGGEEQYPNLLEIGKEIVEKCKGVPLAVKTLAGLLYSKLDEHEWKFIRDNEIWHLEQNEGDILPALRLSYNQLPLHLKQCFSYCSLFPKDYEFLSIKLIQFWMAHGALQSHENKELEDIGDLYIKELLSRSFFQYVNENLYCCSFVMHDLMHDLALSVAQGESLIVTKKSVIDEKVRHLSFVDNGQEFVISRFKYLRVLDFSDSSFEVLSSSVGALKHLRYLSLSSNWNLKKLPNSICKLYNLQTLLLDGCINLERLPKGIRNMINLRVLLVTTKHTCLSENVVGCLKSLRTFIVVQCPSLRCLFEGMDGCLSNLRTLVVVNCPKLTSLSLNIKHLTALETLIIDNCEELNLTEEDSQDLKLSLQKLKIVTSHKFAVLPQWLQGSANTLQHLEIEECYNFMALPDWFPILKSLQTLIIIDCPKLSSLPEGMQGLTTLRELIIRDCHFLTGKRIQEDWYKIAHIPEIDLDEDSDSESALEMDDDMSVDLREEDDEGSSHEEDDEGSSHEENDELSFQELNTSHNQ